MSQSVRPVWIIERAVSRGKVRIGVAGYRFVAELNLRRVPLANNDILTIQEIAASRHTANMYPTLRDGGYSHLLGGQIALLPGEAKMLKDVAMGTPEGLVLHREKLVEALPEDAEEQPEAEDIISGLGHHGDEHALRIGPARQALLDFDAKHPEILAAIVAGRKA